ncbi:MAG: response regulator [Candidatus Magasanikbacteria bacterium]|nr:response regulator [Candidatus Magasanikbacteria bacterium]
MPVQILLIDDQEDLLWVTEIFLQSAGYMVHSATDAETALRLFASVDCDAVITDYNMPGMNGDELAGRLAKIRPIRALVVTSAKISKHGGNADQTLRQAFRIQVGANTNLAFVAKPYAGSELLEPLADVLCGGSRQS